MMVILSKCNFEMRSSFKKKKPQYFQLCKMKHRVPKFQLNFLRVEKAFCINQYLFKVFQLTNKDLARIKYNYFITGDAKTLVKLKEKQGKFLKSCPYTHLQASFWDFFAWLVLSFCQSTKLLAEVVTIAYSSLE